MKTIIKGLTTEGFTLIELMIVVGIIGILVAIAAPNFSRYQSKARQSEAKIALAGIYSGEQSFFSEYSVYIGSMDAIGYAPEGSKRFYGVGWAGAPTSPFGGYAGAAGNANLAALNNTFTCTNTSYNYPAATGANATTFTVNADGCIRQGAANMDRWTINNSKFLQNIVNSL